MNIRARRAIRFGTAGGYWASGIGFVTALVHRTDFGRAVLAQVLAVVLATFCSFVFWFALVAGFAYAFPPSTDELTTRTDFPGAGRIVWPVVLALVAATVYLVIAYR